MNSRTISNRQIRCVTEGWQDWMHFNRKQSQQSYLIKSCIAIMGARQPAMCPLLVTLARSLMLKKLKPLPRPMPTSANKSNCWPTTIRKCMPHCSKPFRWIGAGRNKKADVHHVRLSLSGRWADNLRWRFPPPRGPIKILVETHDDQIVFLCRRVLIGVVKIKAESPGVLDDGLHLDCGK